MKTCPRCHKIYTDHNLNFCLEDGATLVLSGAPDAATVSSAQGDPTIVQQVPSTAPQGWNLQPQNPVPAKKGSKTWVWVLLILGMVVLVCGGGLVGLLVYIASQTPTVTTVSNTAPGNSSTRTTSNSSTTTSVSTTGRNDLQTVNFDRLVQEFSTYGNTAVREGEFVMSGKQKRFYYAIACPKEYTTEKSDTRVSLRNIDSESTDLGYGLIFHSDIRPLQKGYAFLIDTMKRRYRVVNHLPQKENTVVSWTKSTAINEGSEENVLEVRDLDDKIELYINGTMVTSIRNVHGYAGGVAGLYTGDDIDIGFRNFEIRRSSGKL